jgi:hypothetical protein
MERRPPCRRTSGLTTFLTESRKTAKSFSIIAAYAVDAISWNRPRARAGRPLTWGFCEPLADSVTERWVTEDCPGRLLADDCRSRATRQNRAPKANGGMRD